MDRRRNFHPQSQCYSSKYVEKLISAPQEEGAGGCDSWAWGRWELGGRIPGSEGGGDWELGLLGLGRRRLGARTPGAAGKGGWER